MLMKMVSRGGGARLLATAATVALVFAVFRMLSGAQASGRGRQVEGRAERAPAADSLLPGERRLRLSARKSARRAEPRRHPVAG